MESSNASRAPLSLVLKRLTCLNFRCFSSFTVDMEHPLLLLVGANGSGKTSLLEAIYFSCFGRSFRTPHNRHLARIGDQHVTISVQFYNRTTIDDNFLHTIWWGFTAQERLLKLNNKSITSYKEIFDLFRLVALTEDDLSLVQDEPQGRRLFLDQLLVLLNSSYLTTLQRLKHTVASRNALINTVHADAALFDVMTNQLWEYSRLVAQERRSILAALEQIMAPYIKEFFPDINFSIAYDPKNQEDSCTTYEAWKLQRGSQFFSQEQRYKRGLFGAHLDDFHCYYNNKNVRFFASRGQQKMLLVLLKVAQLKLIIEKRHTAIFLIDDFILDFDQENLEILLSILCSLPVQLIFTSPAPSNAFVTFLEKRGVFRVDIP